MQSPRFRQAKGPGRPALARTTVLVSAMLAAFATPSFVTAAGAGSAVDNGSGPVVTTSDGQVRGFTNDAGVMEFLGIPYAAPPVGNMRWRPPGAVEPWKGVRDGTSFQTPCAQVTTLIWSHSSIWLCIEWQRLKVMRHEVCCDDGSD